VFWPTLVAIILALIVQCFIATRSHIVLRFLLLAQVFYWAMAYVVRPIYLHQFSPQPNIGDNIADPRLANAGYEVGLDKVMPIVAVGLWMYVAAWLLLRALKPQVGEPGPTAPLNRQALYLVWMLGWLLRVGQLVAPTNGILFTLALLAPAAGNLLIFTADEDTEERPSRTLVVLAGEFLWTYITVTKSPAVAALIALCLRYVRRGWSRQSIGRLVVVAMVVLTGFSSFQAYKLGEEATTNFETAAMINYPGYVRPTLQVVRRFDLLSAVTDAAYYPAGGWLNPTDFAVQAMKSMVPTQLVGERENAGRRWNVEVRSASYPGAGDSQVSLAEGYIAEGYLLGGFLGVTFGAIVIALLTRWISFALYSRRIWLRLWAILFITFPAIMERGVLGNLELLSKTFQAAMVAWVLYSILSELKLNDRQRA
jgi:hypothetical protein